MQWCCHLERLSGKMSRECANRRELCERPGAAIVVWSLHTYTPDSPISASGDSTTIHGYPLFRLETPPDLPKTRREDLDFAKFQSNTFIEVWNTTNQCNVSARFRSTILTMLQICFKMFLQFSHFETNTTTTKLQQGAHICGNGQQLGIGQPSVAPQEICIPPFLDARTTLDAKPDKLPSLRDCI